MNTNIITCPKCKAEIPLTDAMAQQAREQMEQEFAARQQRGTGTEIRPLPSVVAVGAQVQAAEPAASLSEQAVDVSVDRHRRAPVNHARGASPHKRAGREGIAVPDNLRRLLVFLFSI